MHKNNAVGDTSRVSPYPFDFSALREGDIDPVLGKHVKWLIDSDDNYIVYVDQDHYVEWTMNSNEMLANAGDLLTRVGWLEAVEVEHLSELQIETYERMVGEGVARLFNKDRAAASAALDTAEKWITARNQEAARVWYLEGAIVGVLLVLIPFLLALRLWGLDAMIYQRPIIVTATILGAIGAWLSVLQRSGQTALDLAAGALIQRTEGLVRVLSGAIGALFVALLLRAGVLTSVNANTSKSLFLAICIVAGISERLVNSLAGSVEAATGLALPKANAPANSPPRGPIGPDAAPRPAGKKTTTLSKDSVTWTAPTPPPES